MKHNRIRILRRNFRHTNRHSIFQHTSPVHNSPGQLHMMRPRTLAMHTGYCQINSLPQTTSGQPAQWRPGNTNLASTFECTPMQDKTNPSRNYFVHCRVCVLLCRECAPQSSSQPRPVGEDRTNLRTPNKSSVAKQVRSKLANFAQTCIYISKSFDVEHISGGFDVHAVRASGRATAAYFSKTPAEIAKIMAGGRVRVIDVRLNDEWNRPIVVDEATSPSQPGTRGLVHYSNFFLTPALPGSVC